MRVDWETKTLVDCGRPSKTEEYIWQLVVGSDKQLYGCTYPNAKLVRYNPVTGKGEDLGRMSPTEEYNSFIAASADGFIYSGIGFKIDIAAYQIASGQSRSILPALRRAAGRQLPSHGECVQVYNGADGHAIASVDGVWARLDGWNATNATQSQIEKDPRLAGGLMLADGNHVHYDGRAVTICEGSRLTPGGSCKQTNQTHALSPPYSGREQNIFRIGIGPDGLLCKIVILSPICLLSVSLIQKVSLFQTAAPPCQFTCFMPTPTAPTAQPGPTSITEPPTLLAAGSSIRSSRGRTCCSARRTMDTRQSWRTDRGSRGNRAWRPAATPGIFISPRPTIRQRVQGGVPKRVSAATFGLGCDCC